MSRKSRKNEAFDLPSFQMIRAASNGDIEAINAVLKHYEGYIAALSTRKMYDEKKHLLSLIGCCVMIIKMFWKNF